jgi:aspartyl/glutamyl-tRNA(Asn/Gln) amidotransferase C subunit
VSTSLDRGTVLRVARLARLRLVESEIDDYLQKLSTILDYVKQLKEVPTDDVEPMAHAVELNNVFHCCSIAAEGIGAEQCAQDRWEVLSGPPDH